MSFFSVKLNAQDFFGPVVDPNENSLKSIKEAMDNAKKENPNWRYKFEKEEAINAKSCGHCPVHLLLAEQINDVVETMAKDPKAPAELPVKINRLKFLYYTVAMKEINGKKDCKRYMDYTPDLKPTRFDGQFRLMAEDVLSFSKVNSFQYINPEMEEVIYYYRGEGSEKNIVVQAIMNKEGGKFRYYRYTPTAAETNPYNLPDMSSVDAPEKAQSTGNEALSSSTAAAPGTPAKSTDGLDIKFKADVKMQNKIIPKNVYFVAATFEQEIVEGLKVKATSDTSLKGNSAVMFLKAPDGSDLGQINLDTKISGETNYKVTVPYSVRVLDEAKVSGKIEAQNNGQVVTMSVGDKAMEYVRSEYRRNTLTGQSSYLLAKDIQINTSQSLSLLAGSGEDKIKYASVKHIQNVNKNITLVLDVRVDQNKTAAVYYQMGAKF
jgi:hypothetical protein